jgi:hypothetical protein
MAGTVKRIIWGTVKWGIPLLVAGFSSYWGYKVKYIDPYHRGDPDNKIQASDGRYHGTWNNHCTAASKIRCYEERFGEKADISFRFINFRELRSDKPFPAQEAKYMRNRGGVLYLELEPFEGAGSPDLLTRILNGDMDKRLDAFAKGAAKYDGPVFLSFGHEMNTDEHVWSRKAQLYVRAYRYVHDRISRYAPNVTWVWNPAIDNNTADIERYYPGDQYVDWAGISFFHHTGDSIDGLVEVIDKTVAVLKKHGKPLMISRFGSSAGDMERAQFFDALTPKFKEWGIEGFIYFNFYELSEDGTITDFLIRGERSEESFRRMLRNLDLDGNIVTAGGELSGRQEPLPGNCAEVEQIVMNAYELRMIEETKAFISNREGILSSNAVTSRDSHEDNKLRLQTAKAYRELWRIFDHMDLEDQADAYAQKALEHLNRGLNHPDGTIQFHPFIPYVREYFDLLLEKVDLLYELRQSAAAYQELDQIDEKLSNWEVTLAQNISPESVPGYQNRAHLIRAQLLERDENYEGAYSLYAGVSGWATREQAKGKTSLWWAGENRHDLRFIATMARLGLIRHELMQMYRIAAEVSRINATEQYRQMAEDRLAELADQILQRVAGIQSWEEAGCEATGCFMDRGFESLIDAMETCLMSSNGDLRAAKNKFRAKLPWALINTYADFKKSLQIEEIDLTEDPWDPIITGLSRVLKPGDPGYYRFVEIRAYSETR